MTSLCMSSMEAFTRMVSVFSPDGTGGQALTVSAGDGFSAVLVPEKGSGDGQETFTVVTEEDVVLGFSEYIRRDADGTVFRVLSDGAYGAVPSGARPSPAMRLRTVRAVRCIGAEALSGNG